MIQILFGGEVAEQDGFADTGGGGDVLGLGAAEAVAREAIDGAAQQLAVAVVGRHPALAEGGGYNHK